MSDQYLTYSPVRNAAWVGHTCFPKGSIRRKAELLEKFPDHPVELRIYRIHPGGDVVTEIPEAEWDDYQE